MGQWDQLPFDLLNKIDEHLELYQDKVRSKCVCVHWDHSFPELPDLENQPPWLLLPFATGSLCGLFRPFEKNMYVIDLPEAEEKVCKGSDHGWVVTVQKDGSINVVNPLTRARFALPPRYKFTDVVKHHPEKVGHEYLMIDLSLEEGYVPEPPSTFDAEHLRNHLLQKIALSCAPSRSSDFRAVAIYGEIHRLAYCKLGDKKWTDMVDPNNEQYSCVDITFCNGILYALNKKLELLVCDDIVSCPELRKLLPALKGSGVLSSQMYLIKSLDNDQIMVVRREMHLHRHRREVQKSEHCSTESQGSKLIYKTCDFKIYKMNPTRSGWICMESLGDDEILFMGMGGQLGIRGKSVGIKGRGNQIYFTDHRLSFDSQDIQDCFDQGTFSFKDKEIVKSLGYEINQIMIFPSPIWVTPNPY